MNLKDYQTLLRRKIKRYIGKQAMETKIHYKMSITGICDKGLSTTHGESTSTTSKVNWEEVVEGDDEDDEALKDIYGSDTQRVSCPELWKALRPLA